MKRNIDGEIKDTFFSVSDCIIWLMRPKGRNRKTNRKEMKYMKKVTVSLIKADVGGFPGHVSVHPDLKEARTGDSKERGTNNGLSCPSSWR